MKHALSSIGAGYFRSDPALVSTERHNLKIDTSDNLGQAGPVSKAPAMRFTSWMILSACSVLSLGACSLLAPPEPDNTPILIVQGNRQACHQTTVSLNRQPEIPTRFCATYAPGRNEISVFLNGSKILSGSEAQTAIGVGGVYAGTVLQLRCPAPSNDATADSGRRCTLSSTRQELTAVQIVRR